MVREHNAIMANGKSPKYFVEKWVREELEKRRLEEDARIKKEEEERREREERAKAQKGSSEGGDVRREVNLNGILTPDIDDINISFVTGDTYADTVHAFREACQRDPNSRQPLWTCEDGTQIPRAFTISELLILKVEDFETTIDKEGRERSLTDRLRTFTFYNDTCSANVYGDNGDFKLVQLYKPFIEIPQNPGLNSTGGLPADFADVDAPMIRSGNGGYGQWLTKEQIMNSEFWRNAAGDTDEGVKVLDAYSNIVLANIGDNNTAMAVHLSSYRNEARALCVGSLGDRSGSDGDYSLNLNARFPRVSQAPQR